nr:MAG TPA: hypothetical protein [Caudoviricetes sp.]
MLSLLISQIALMQIGYMQEILMQTILAVEL